MTMCSLPPFREDDQAFALLPWLCIAWRGVISLRMHHMFQGRETYDAPERGSKDYQR